jgi:hypothetical protein
MVEHRITFALFGLSQRKFNSLAKALDSFVAAELDEVYDYEVYTTPSGPSDWAASDVDIHLAGIRASRSGAVSQKR